MAKKKDLTYLVGATVVLTYKKSEKWEDTYAWFKTRIGKKVKLSVEKQPVMGKIKKVDVADKIVVYVEILEVLRK